MPKRTAKKMIPLSVRLDEDVREGLDKLAEEQERSVSYLVNIAVRRFVEAGGKVPKKS